MEINKGDRLYIAYENSSGWAVGVFSDVEMAKQACRDDAKRRDDPEPDFFTYSKDENDPDADWWSYDKRVDDYRYHVESTQFNMGVAEWVAINKQS